MIVGSDIEWLEPWQAVSESEATQLETELRRELAPGHAIFGRRATAVGARRDCDDVLFELLDPAQLAVVHLSYATHPDRPPWPSTELYSDFADFGERAMRPDHLDYTDEAG